VETKDTYFYFCTFFAFFYYFIVFFKERFYSPDIYTFRFGSTCNPDCSICVNYGDCPWFFLFMNLCFAEYTIFQYQYFSTNCVIIINSFLIFINCILISLALPVVSYFFQSAMKGISNNISRPKIAAPGEAFSTV